MILTDYFSNFQVKPHLFPGRSLLASSWHRSFYCGITVFFCLIKNAATTVAKDRLALLCPDDVGAFGFRTLCWGLM